jgi:hypothetical protein
LKRNSKISAIILIVAISLPILWIFDPIVIVATDLAWDVQAGDEFHYQIRYMYQTYNLGYIPDEVAIWLRPLNNSQIIFEITDLPIIPLLMTSTGFADLIISYNKCEVRFENGSDIADNHRNLLNSLFSNCLLPIGDWNYLDGLYPDTHPTSSLYDLNRCHKSYFSDDDFFIGNTGSSHHGSAGWNGLVNTTNGVPQSIRQYEGWYWGDGTSYSYSLLLSLEE